MNNLQKMTTAELITYQTGYKQTTREWKMCEEELVRRRNEAKPKAWHETATGKIAIGVIVFVLGSALTWLSLRYGLFS